MSSWFFERSNTLYPKQQLFLRAHYNQLEHTESMNNALVRSSVSHDAKLSNMARVVVGLQSVITVSRDTLRLLITDPMRPISDGENLSHHH